MYVLGVVVVLVAFLETAVVHAAPDQSLLVLENKEVVLNFDDIEITDDPFPPFPVPYHALNFSGIGVFPSDDPDLRDLIPPEDRKCAVSPPNAAIGDAREDPEIVLATNSGYSSFGLKSLNIKPIFMLPFSYTRVHINGTQVDKTELHWSVDFPHGFHDMLAVDIEEFSHQKWDQLISLRITGRFKNGDGSFLGYETCFDDLVLSLEK